MVFPTISLWYRQPLPVATKGPDRFWKRRKFLKFAAHFYGRKQNCYTVALRSIIKALTYSCNSRKLKPITKRELHETRLQAACEEHGFTYPLLRESLIQSNILLNRKVLVDLAVWEPRTFKSIVDFAWNKAKCDKINGIERLEDPPSNVILKPMTLK